MKKTLKELLNESHSGDIKSYAKICAQFINEFQISDITTDPISRTAFILNGIYGFNGDASDTPFSKLTIKYKFINSDENKELNDICKKIYNYNRFKYYFEFGKWDAEKFNKDWKKYKTDALSKEELERLDYLANKIKK